MARQPKPHELRELRKEKNRKDTWRPDRNARLLLPERHLFITEGTKTEPNYLHGIINLIIQRYGHAAERQFQVIGEGDNTLYLLMRAEAYLQNDSDGFRHIWILYDKDDFPPDHFDNTVSRCVALNKRYADEGRDIEFHAIWSNECIELWFLLHFDYMDAKIDRGQYRAKLSEHLGKHYDKSDDALFSYLQPRIHEAIRNARKLKEDCDRQGLPPSQMSPCTVVYELIEELYTYIVN